MGMVFTSDDGATLSLPGGRCIYLLPAGDAIVFTGRLAIGDVMPLIEAREVWAEWGGADEDFRECESYMESLR